MESLWRSEDKTNPGLHCEAYYLADTHQYEVRASFKDRSIFERFIASYEPRWGIDVADLELIYEIASNLAHRLAEPDLIDPVLDSGLAE